MVIGSYGGGMEGIFMEEEWKEYLHSVGYGSVGELEMSSDPGSRKTETGG